MKPLFLNGRPALFLKKERALVAGDLHVGTELKMKEKGLFFAKASARMGEEMLQAYKLCKARSIVLLGDVKENVSYSSEEEVRAIREFFAPLNGIEIRIAKGNHDAYLERILKGQHIEANIEKEVLLGDAALMHGNFWPSEDAMRKRYIITGHGHIAARVNMRAEKAWLIAGAGKMAAKVYERLNKSVELIVAPAFNPLITGTPINDRTRSFIPLFKGDVFDFYNAKVYALDGRVLGSARKVVKENEKED